jgi:hypothetical protein
MKTLPTLPMLLEYRWVITQTALEGKDGRNYRKLRVHKLILDGQIRSAPPRDVLHALSKSISSSSFVAFAKTLGKFSCFLNFLNF